MRFADFTEDRTQKMRIFLLCEAREGTVKESSEMVDEWIKYDNYYGISPYGFFKKKIPVRFYSGPKIYGSWV